jgi:hypothetical protein
MKYDMSLLILLKIRKKNMPQFDFYTFPEQTLYLLVGFFTTYFFIVKCYLPHIAAVIKMRNKLLKYYSLKNQAAYHLNIIEKFYASLFKKQN